MNTPKSIAKKITKNVVLIISFLSGQTVTIRSRLMFAKKSKVDLNLFFIVFILCLFYIKCVCFYIVNEKKIMSNYKGDILNFESVTQDAIYY